MTDTFKDVVSIRSPHGAILVDGQHVADTLQCVHCGAHWIPRKGSGIIRGFCKKCMGPICGPSCSRCVPQEKMLEMMERS